MNLKWLITAALFSTASLALAADPVPTLTPNIAVKAVPAASSPAPIRIVRKPYPALQTGAITNRLLPKTAIAELVQRGMTPTRLVVGAKPVARAPDKQALLIILENGGVMKNVDPALRTALNRSIVTVTCDEFEFELRQGQSLPELLASISSQLVGNLACLDPRNWRQSTFNPLTWLNDVSDDALESAITANNSLINTQSRYEKVVVLEDADAVPARVLAVIRELAPQYVLDIHVLTHGGNERFVGHNGTDFTQENFFAPLDADRKNGLPLYLRAVYQMNCRGGTLKNNWRALGAVTVNGTVGSVDNNMPHQYFPFLRKWIGTTGMSDASQQSFEETALISRPIYALVGQGALVNESRLTAEGTSANANVNSAR